MTDKPTPTDAELKAMWQIHAADIGGIFYYARAVLAKWGTPATGGEPAGTVGYTVHGTQYVNWRTKPPAHGTPLYTTPQPTRPDPAYSEACNLATALFKKHFARLPDFASGQAVWSLCDSTAGVISQIDNMVAGLVQPPTTSPQADSVQEDAALWHWLAEYLVGTRTDLDDEIVASETVNDLRKLVKAAIKQGATP